MGNSKRIAALVGPTIVAMVASEFPWCNPISMTLRFRQSSISLVC